MMQREIPEFVNIIAATYANEKGKGFKIISQD